MSKIFYKHYDIVAFCIKISFCASPALTIFRFFLETMTSLLPLLSMYFSKEIINNLLYTHYDHSKINSVIWLIALSGVLIILTSAVGLVKTYASQYHNNKIDLLISEKKLIKSTQIDLSYFDSSKYYDDFTNATMNSAAIPAIVWNVFSLFGSFIKFLGVFIIFTRYSIIFALLLVILSIPSAVLENRAKDKLLNLQKELIPLNRRMGYVGSIYTNRAFAIDMRINNISDHLYGKFKNDWKIRFDENNKINKKYAVNAFLLSNIPQIIIIISTIFLAISVSRKNMLIGDYTYLTGSAHQLLSSIVVIIGAFCRYKDNVNRASDFIDFLNLESTVKDEGIINLEKDSTHKIRFENVFFKYPGTENNILEDVTFEFCTNNKISFVGINGSGKTTIIKLLLRLYDVDSGTIYIDGINIKEYSLSSIRNYYSIMPQSFNNYAFTLRENIALSDINNLDNDKMIISSLQKANAISVLEKIGGLDVFLTRIYDEKGVELSGGEWQKIALARCFFKPSKTLILDEPSASIDAKSEFELFQNISKEYKESGAILVSHRLANVNSSDHIYVLHNKKIIEHGTHEDLMNKKGLYCEMYTLQLKKYI